MPLSRWAYSGMHTEGVASQAEASAPARDAAGLALILVLVLPVAIDIVLLPVTGIHDILFVR